MVHAAQGGLPRPRIVFSIHNLAYRGIVPAEEVKVAAFARKMMRGSLDALVPREFGVAIGREMAGRRGISVAG
jgi:lipoprotein-releasing system permease protein